MVYSSDIVGIIKNIKYKLRMIYKWSQLIISKCKEP